MSAMDFPRVIIHNSISIDGALLDFDVHLEHHYRIVGQFHAQAHLIGSNTIKEGIKRYGTVSEETDKDFSKPVRDETLPYWMIIDSTGKLEGLLHEVRRFELNRDVIVCVSKKTPPSYIDYLKKRQYSYHVIGDDKVDLEKMMDCISREYQVDTVLVDSGRILGDILLNNGMVSSVSILIHPFLVGEKGYYLFSDISKRIRLKLERSEIIDDEYVWLFYHKQ